MPKRTSSQNRKAVVSRKKKQNRSRQNNSSAINKSRSIWLKRGLMLFLLASLGMIVYVFYLDITIRSQFEGKRWALPAKVYARSLEVYPGKILSKAQFLYELNLLGYRYAWQTTGQTTGQTVGAGSYSQEADTFYLRTRSFQFWDGREEAQHIKLQFDRDRVESIADGDTGSELELLRLQPAIIGRIYPAHNEDRLLVKLSEVPILLIKGLLALEDRDFFEHHGINPRAIGRALLADLRAGQMVQGGSTLTQQLIKNFFLSNQRTVWRKVNEAIMSLLIEWHYDKDEILEAYLNEIYLGQDKNRAIHGFGLASRFYYDKPLEQLDLAQSATLIALVRGPSYYDPWRNSKRLLQRRNLVLSVMAEQNIITTDTARRVQLKALNIVPRPSGVSGDYPAFLELVRHQLRRDYRPRDLSAEGLQIFTSLDPWLQKTVEQVMNKRIEQLDRQYNLHNELQGAAILTDTSHGEILALTGGRNAQYAGFNRALNASRPIGSLVKPAVYLTALENKNNHQQQQYTLATLLDDTGLSLKSKDGDLWTPRNYDGESHGQVPLATALIHSYNQATVRLGMQSGFESIVDTLHRLGVMQEIDPYPSMLLGAINLTPYEVTQMYQTLASGGFNTPLRAVREVLAVDATPLRRFPLNVKQTIEPEAVQMVSSTLHQVTQAGTARSLKNILPVSLKVAGKTGTTNDLRDSWFAGYSGSHLGVVWLGRDDNQPTGLTGSSGALRVWADIFMNIETQPLEPLWLDTLEYHWMDKNKGLLTDEACESALYLPFKKGSLPSGYTGCSS